MGRQQQPPPTLADTRREVVRIVWRRRTAALCLCDLCNPAQGPSWLQRRPNDGLWFGRSPQDYKGCNALERLQRLQCMTLTTTVQALAALQLSLQLLLF